MQQLEFHLRGEFVELCNLLKLTGVCDSGGAGKALVAEGAGVGRWQGGIAQDRQDTRRTGGEYR